jgi:hypothetical protein
MSVFESSVRLAKCKFSDFECTGAQQHLFGSLLIVVKCVCIAIEAPWPAVMTPAQSAQLSGAAQDLIFGKDDAINQEAEQAAAAACMGLLKTYSAEETAQYLAQPPFNEDDQVRRLTLDEPSLEYDESGKVSPVSTFLMNPGARKQSISFVGADGQPATQQSYIRPAAPPDYGSLPLRALLPYAAGSPLNVERDERVLKAALQRYGTLVLLGDQRLVGVGRVTLPGLCKEEADRAELPLIKLSDVTAAGLIDGKPVDRFSHEDYSHAAVVAIPDKDQPLLGKPALVLCRVTPVRMTLEAYENTLAGLCKRIADSVARPSSSESLKRAQKTLLEVRAAAQQVLKVYQEAGNATEATSIVVYSYTCFDGEAVKKAAPALFPTLYAQADQAKLKRQLTFIAKHNNRTMVAAEFNLLFQPSEGGGDDERQRMRLRHISAVPILPPVVWTALKSLHPTLTLGAVDVEETAAAAPTTTAAAPTTAAPTTTAAATTTASRADKKRKETAEVIEVPDDSPEDGDSSEQHRAKKSRDLATQVRAALPSKMPLAPQTSMPAEVPLKATKNSGAVAVAAATTATAPSKSTASSKSVAVDMAVDGEAALSDADGALVEHTLTFLSRAQGAVNKMPLSDPNVQNPFSGDTWTTDVKTLTQQQRDVLGEVAIFLRRIGKPDFAKELLAERAEARVRAAELLAQAAAEAERIRAEAKRKAEEEAAAKRKAEEKAAAEAKRKAEEKAAAEAKRKAEEKAAAEAKRKAEEEAEAKRKAEEEAEAKRKAAADANAPRRDLGDW